MKILLSKIKLFLLEIDRIYDHLYRFFFGMPRPYRSEISRYLFVGGHHKISTLRRFGIRSVVNMRKRNYPEFLKSSDFSYLHLPTTDLTAPTLSQLEEGSSFIRNQIQSSRKTYVHCRLGEGRGPTMVIAYLITTGMTMVDAVEAVRRVRPFIRPTPTQLSILRKFERKHL